MLNKKYILGLICLIMLFTILPFISALELPSQTRTINGGCEILTPDFTEIQQNADLNLYFHVYNQTSYANDDTTNCTFHLYSLENGGLHTLIIPDVSFLPPRDFSVFINGTTNLSHIGRYSYLFECGIPAEHIKTSDQYQVCGIEGEFEVTPNGEEATIGKAVFYIGLLAILLFFIGLSIFGFVSFNNLLARVGLFGFSYLLLIAITFIGWNMANDFITSSPFLIYMLKIMFIVLMAGLFPLVIGAFAYYVIMLFKIKEIENLMKHGMSEQEAEHRAGRKR